MNLDMVDGLRDVTRSHHSIRHIFDPYLNGDPRVIPEIAAMGSHRGKQHAECKPYGALERIIATKKSGQNTQMMIYGHALLN